MKCLVCKKEFAGRECPVCKFPVVDFPGDPEEAMRNFEPTVNRYFSEFSSKISLGIIIRSWDINSDSVVLEKEEDLVLGTAAKALDGVLWCGEMFDEPVEHESSEIGIFAEAEGERYTLTVSVPAVPGAERTEPGISLDRDFMVTVHIREKNGEEKVSEKFYLFGEK